VLFEWLIVQTKTPKNANMTFLPDEGKKWCVFNPPGVGYESFDRVFFKDLHLNLASFQKAHGYVSWFYTHCESQNAKDIFVQIEQQF
jgi:hypothetical protein